jgi:predicted regulator of Ras-like GTPase activity (Roadblock/LC7/MglB family)
VSSIDPAAASPAPSARRGPSSRPSRAEVFRQVLQELGHSPGAVGTLVVATDGLVIAAQLPPGMAAESLGAMAAMLGREMELGTTRLGRGEFARGLFSAEDGSVLLGASRVGFLVVLADRDADIGRIRGALRKGLEAIETAWSPAA